MRTTHHLYLLPGLVLLALYLPHGAEQRAGVAAQPVTTAAVNTPFPPPDAWEGDAYLGDHSYCGTTWHIPTGLFPDQDARFEWRMTWPEDGYRSWRDEAGLRLVFTCIDEAPGPDVEESPPALTYQDSVLAHVRASLRSPSLQEASGEAMPPTLVSTPVEEMDRRYGVYATPSGAPLLSGSEPTLRNWLSKDSVPWADPGILVPEPAPLTEQERVQLMEELDRELHERTIHPVENSLTPDQP